jgi:hypothetical protein
MTRVIALGLRMPWVPAAVPPMPNSGSSSSFSTPTVWLSSPLSVLSKEASPVTVIDSADEPTSRLRSTRRVCATSTVRPDRLSFLNPETATVTSYCPAGNCGMV